MKIIMKYILTKSNCDNIREYTQISELKTVSGVE